MGQKSPIVIVIDSQDDQENGDGVIGSDNNGGGGCAADCKRFRDQVLAALGELLADGGDAVPVDPGVKTEIEIPQPLPAPASPPPLPPQSLAQAEAELASWPELSEARLADVLLPAIGRGFADLRPDRRVSESLLALARARPRCVAERLLPAAAAALGASAGDSGGAGRLLCELASAAGDLPGLLRALCDRRPAECGSDAWLRPLLACLDATDPEASTTAALATVLGASLDGLLAELRPRYASDERWRRSVQLARLLHLLATRWQPLLGATARRQLGDCLRDNLSLMRRRLADVPVFADASDSQMPLQA